MSLKEVLTKCRPCPLIVIEKHGNYFNGVLTLVRRQIMVVQSHFVKSTEFMIWSRVKQIVKIKVFGA